MKNLKLVLLVLLTVCFVGSVLAQEKSDNPENQCRNYGKKDFVGEVITHNFIETDFREFLTYLTDKFGCSFVIDKSVGKVDLTVKIDNVPWNVVLDELLKRSDLGLQIQGFFFRIAKKETLEEEKKSYRLTICTLGEVSPLITEKIKLKYIPDNRDFGKEKLLGVITRRLSNRGLISFDDKSKTLIVTDEFANLDVIKKLIEIMDVEVNLNEYLIQKKKKEEAMQKNHCFRPSND